MRLGDVEVELQRVKPQPGELLVLTVKSDDVTDVMIKAIRERFRLAIENLGASNQMMVFGIAPEDDVELQAVPVKDGDLVTMTIKSEYDRSDDVPALEQRLQDTLDRMGVKAGALVLEVDDEDEVDVTAEKGDDPYPMNNSVLERIREQFRASITNGFVGQRVSDVTIQRIKEQFNRACSEGDTWKHPIFPDYHIGDGKKKVMADSLQDAFNNGNVVLGGGDIMDDRVVVEAGGVLTRAKLEEALQLARDIDFQYVATAGSSLRGKLPDIDVDMSPPVTITVLEPGDPVGYEIHRPGQPIKRVVPQVDNPALQAVYDKYLGDRDPFWKQCQEMMDKQTKPKIFSGARAKISIDGKEIGLVTDIKFIDEAQLGFKKDEVITLTPGVYRTTAQMQKEMGFATVQHPKGTCPSCGHKGEFRMMALTCPTHGTFGGC